jgi:siroheme decarboxylase
MDDIDRAIVNRLQDGIEVCERPFAAVAQALGIPEPDLMERLKRLLAEGTLSRFGPMYNAAEMGGAFTLAAMSVPSGEFDHVAGLVNAHPEVAHNYERDHPLNMWFVVATEQSEGVGQVIAEIECETGLRIVNLPKLNEYFLDLRLPVQP